MGRGTEAVRGLAGRTPRSRDRIVPPGRTDRGRDMRGARRDQAGRPWQLTDGPRHRGCSRPGRTHTPQPRSDCPARTYRPWARHAWCAPGSSRPTVAIDGWAEAQRLFAAWPDAHPAAEIGLSRPDVQTVGATCVVRAGIKQADRGN